MPITQDDIDNLKAIYENQFGETLSSEEAWEMGIRLVNLYYLLLGDKHEPIDPKIMQSK